jgi:hypothetical protein
MILNSEQNLPTLGKKATNLEIERTNKTIKHARQYLESKRSPSNMKGSQYSQMSGVSGHSRRISRTGRSRMNQSVISNSSAVSRASSRKIKLDIGSGDKRKPKIKK